MTQVAENLSSGYEPIPGYVLRDRIGAGGFGEVWSAEAPGGLEKAIKIVYGTMDSERASREMRSLERLRKVHHPFLLNLERFEVVNNRLMIVTERADEGLDQIVGRYQSQGLSGIPREELLTFMMETADALDHLRERYGLQHLDVKPANLLVLSGHIKVADFGLVKDLRDADCSIIGGLTPTYAAPEVFDGRPSIHSDQYSLAIVFQELLTGQRPFNGRTIAQLATQHVHSAPNLESLPFVDRPVIARALEKNPDRRFATCSELVHRLRDTSVRPQRLPASIGPCEPAGDTVHGNINELATGNIEDLPAVALTHSESTAINFPLLIGLGGLGAEVLSQVRSDLGERTNVKLRCLLIDTDAELLESACTAPRALGRLTPDQTLHLPLKTAHEYREFVSGSLASISRRWLYNVPRSGRTEGLRPVGRLALVNHSQIVLQRLRLELENLPTTGGAEVFVVASLSGGTGSGMIWDLLHILRHLLDETNRAEVKIRPILATAWAGSRYAGPLQLASSHAALTEAMAYAHPEHAYPGDRGAGFAPVPAGRSPLKDAYLVAPMGNDLAADLISQYLQLNLGATAPTMAVIRHSELNSSSDLCAHTAGLVRLQLAGTPGFERLLTNSEYLTVRSLLQNSSNHESLVGSMVNTWQKQLRDALEPTATAWQSQTFGEQEPEIRRRIEEMAIELTGGTQELAAELSAVLMLRKINQKLTEQINRTESLFQYTPISAALNSLMTNLRQRFKDGQLNLPSIVSIFEQLAECVAALKEERQSNEHHLTLESDKYSEQVRIGTLSTSNEQVFVSLGELGLLRIRIERERIVLRHLDELSRQLAERIEAWGEKTRLAAGLAISLRKVIELAAVESPDGSRSIALTVERKQALGEHAVRLRERLLNATKTSTIEQSLAQLELDLRQSFKKDGMEPLDYQCISEFAEKLPEILMSARPALLECGGKQRRVLLVADIDQQKLFEPLVGHALGSEVTTYIVPGMKPTFVHEGQGVAISQAVARLVTALGPEHRLVGRLQARADLDK